MPNVARRAATLVAALAVAFAVAIAIIAIGCAGDTPPPTDDAAPRAIAQQRDESQQQAASNAPPDRFVTVSAGAGHACGLGENGAIGCWGYNGDEQADAPTRSRAARSREADARAIDGVLSLAVIAGVGPSVIPAHAGMTELGMGVGCCLASRYPRQARA